MRERERVCVCVCVYKLNGTRDYGLSEQIPLAQEMTNNIVRYLRGRIKAGTHGLSAVERAYGRLWSMADRTWQIEHRGEFRLALRRATSLPRGNKRDYVSYKTLV